MNCDRNPLEAGLKPFIKMKKVTVLFLTFIVKMENVFESEGEHERM